MVVLYPMSNECLLGRYSKQAFLADVQQPYDLPDGTPSFKDYMGNKNNRFINPEMASKNRIQPPSKVCIHSLCTGDCECFVSFSLLVGWCFRMEYILGLFVTYLFGLCHGIKLSCSFCLQILHFFNTPPGLDEETLKHVFMEGEVAEPKSIKLFPSKSECEDL